MATDTGHEQATEREKASARWAAYWNAPVAATWVTFQERLDALFEPLSEVAFEAAKPRPGDKVVDVGCGCGATSLALARLVGPSGHVLAVDISAQLLARARELRAASDLGQISFVLGDAAAYAFPPHSQDLVFSRVGAMFFGDPVAAFSNLHRALKDDGRMVLVCPRPFVENPYIASTVQVARPMLPADAFPTTPPGQPGMFSMADPARVSAILKDAGFRSSSLKAVDLPMRLGATAAEATELSLQFGPIPGALQAATPETRAAVLDAITRAFARIEGPGGVSLAGAFWVISAIP